MLSLQSLARLAAQYAPDLDAAVRNFDIAGRPFDFAKRPHLMGVINLSPDSWYRESVCLSPETALRRGRVLAAQGADIIDIGAESTLAHAARADESLQTSMLLPVIRALAAEGLVLSVETYLPAVARAAFEAGARVLNLTGHLDNPDLYAIVRDHQGAVILCYVQGEHVRAVADFEFATDMAGRMRESFARAIDRATAHGVERIFIDPGLGFYYRNLQDGALRVRHQIETFLHTFRLRSLGWPVCHALPHAFEFFGAEVTTAESFFAVPALLGKTDLLRTHEIPRVKAVADTLAQVP